MYHSQTTYGSEAPSEAINGKGSSNTDPSIPTVRGIQDLVFDLAMVCHEIILRARHAKQPLIQKH